MGYASYHDALDEAQAEAEAVIPSPQKQYNDDLATTTFGPLEKYVAANDNVPFKAGDRVSLLGGKSHYVYKGLSSRLSGHSEVIDEDGHVMTYWTSNLRQAQVAPERTGDFMQTYSGRKFWPLDPRPEDVHIEDIAHSLALQCRYAGHVTRFYSVAEHSCHIAWYLLRNHGPLMALAGLLHDATEAYLVDMPRPVKRDMPWYKAMEERVWRAAVSPAFDLPAIIPDAVHEADNRIIADELKLLRPMEWHAAHTDGIGAKVAGWHPDVAEDEFLAMYVMLCGRLGRTKKGRVAV